MNGPSIIKMSGAIAQEPSRHLGLDLTRAIAAILVVYLHASVPYLVHPMPSLVWPVRDEPSAIVDKLFWCIELFIMPLFLLVSGYFAWRGFSSQTGLEMLRGKANRLLRPLAFGVVAILPASLYIWMLGLIADGEVAPAKIRSLKVPPPHGDHLWGFSHLWYLLYLFLYFAVMVGARSVIVALVNDPRAWFARMMLKHRDRLRRGITASLALVSGVTVAFAPQVVYDFQHAFLPFPSKWIYCAAFFAGGLALAVFDPYLRFVNRFAPRHLAIGAIAMIASVQLGTWWLVQVEGDSQRASNQWLAQSCLAVTTVLAAWTLSLGILGGCNRLAGRLTQHPRLSRLVGYLAAASFWIYLIHHPLVGLVATDLKWLMPSVPPLVKSLIVLSAGLLLPIATYQWLILGTRFGVFIGVEQPSSSRFAKTTDNGKEIGSPGAHVPGTHDPAVITALPTAPAVRRAA